MPGRNVAALVMVALVLLVLLIWLLSGGMMGLGARSGMMGWNGPSYSDWGIVMFFVGALMPCGAVFLGASLLSRWRGAPTGPVAVSVRPLDTLTLKERHARGELTREEHDQIGGGSGL